MESNKMNIGKYPEFISDCYDPDDFEIDISGHINSNKADNVLVSGYTYSEFDRIPGLKNVENVANVEALSSPRGLELSSSALNQLDSNMYMNEILISKPKSISNSTESFQYESNISTDTSIHLASGPNQTDFYSCKDDESMSVIDNISEEIIIGAGHYGAFSSNNNEQSEPKNEDPLDLVMRTMNRFSISNDTRIVPVIIEECQFLIEFRPSTQICDLFELLRHWCMDGPFPTFESINIGGKNITIEESVKCDFETWHQMALRMKQHIENGINEDWKNCIMVRYYGSLYPDNGRDQLITKREHFFA